MYQRPSPMTGGQGATFYDVQGNLPHSYTQLSASPLAHPTHHTGGHPWPGLVETAGTQEAMDWAKKNALYLAGGGMIALGLVGWKMGWFR